MMGRLGEPDRLGFKLGRLGESTQLSEAVDPQPFLIPVTSRRPRRNKLRPS
jgi:hypothetical protein